MQDTNAQSTEKSALQYGIYKTQTGTGTHLSIAIAMNVKTLAEIVHGAMN